MRELAYRDTTDGESTVDDTRPTNSRGNGSCGELTRWYGLGER
jgi:hypothetical protein